MNIKKSLILLTVLLLSSITSQAHSSSICEEAAKGLTETNATFSQYFDSYIKNHSAAGYAKIRDVYATSDNNEYQFKLDCGNNVLLLTRSRSGGLRDLKTGQQVSFSGNVEGWSKQFYRDSDKYYIEITLGYSSITY